MTMDLRIRSKTASAGARAFKTSITLLGLAVAASSFMNWSSADPLRFVTLLAMAAVLSAVKSGLGTYPVTVSAGFLFALIGVADFSLGEALLLGFAAAATEMVAGGRNSVRIRQVTLKTFAFVVAIGVGYQVFHSARQESPETSPLWPLVAAATIFSLSDTLSVVLLQENRQGKSAVAAWHEQGFWTLPYHLVGAVMATCFSLVSQEYGWPYAVLVLPAVLVLYRGADRLLAGERLKRESAGLLASRQQQSLEALGLAIAARFHAANHHMSRIQTYALRLAGDLNFGFEQREALRMASVLRDVGTLAVPEQILGKQSRLTQEEFERVKLHPSVGAAIVDRAGFPYPVKPVVRAHHERWDGFGYPDGLKGTQIPLGARVLAVVDCLVALTAERPYRNALPFKQALAFIESQAGQAFDPEVVAALMRRADEFERFTTADMLNTSARFGETGASDFVSEIARARRESQEIYEMALQLGRSLNLHETARTLEGSLKKLVGFETLVLSLKHGERIVPKFVSGIGYSALFAMEMPLGCGISGLVAGTGKPVLNGDAATDLAFAPESAGLRLHSALSVALEGQRDTVGVLTLYRSDEQSFQKEDLSILLGIRAKLAAAVENAKEYERTRDNASTDYVTGLPNSRTLFKRLKSEVSRCGRTGESLTTFVCDLDHFKDTNDRFGHDAGDRVLREVANVLRDNCREYDFVARTGGDEFVVVMPGLTPEAAALRKSKLSLAAAEAAQGACSGSLVGMSIGASRYPDDSRVAEELLKKADERMYATKRGRHSPYQGRGFSCDHVAETTYTSL